MFEFIGLYLFQIKSLQKRITSFKTVNEEEFVLVGTFLFYKTQIIVYIICIYVYCILNYVKVIDSSEK